MNSNRKTAIIVGVLFITATVTSSLSLVLLEPQNAPDYLISVSANENQVLIGMLLFLIDCAAVVAIPVMLFPIFTKHNEAVALGYLSSRIIECVMFLVFLFSSLLLLTLSKEYVRAGAPDASYFQTLGTLLLAANEWTFWMGISIVFPLTALILNYFLYKSKLVPRWLSGFGLIGATLLLAEGLLSIFGLLPSVADPVMSAPIAVQEMVFAVWLIIKGFNSSAIASGSAETDMN